MVCYDDSTVNIVVVIIIIIIVIIKCLSVGSGDNEEWMLAADVIVELMALLQHHGDLTAEFFLLCLEVYQSVCTPVTAVFVWLNIYSFKNVVCNC